MKNLNRENGICIKYKMQTTSVDTPIIIVYANVIYVVDVESNTNY